MLHTWSSENKFFERPADPGTPVNGVYPDVPAPERPAAGTVIKVQDGDGNPLPDLTLGAGGLWSYSFDSDEATFAIQLSEDGGTNWSPSLWSDQSMFNMANSGELAAQASVDAAEAKALAGASGAKSVNGVVPDGTGNVELTAAVIGAIPSSEKGVAGGLAALNADGDVVDAGGAVVKASPNREVLPGGSPGATAVNIVEGNQNNAIGTDVGGGTIVGGGTDTQNNIIGLRDTSTIGTANPNVATNDTGAHYSVVGGYDSGAGGLASIVLGFHNYTEVGTTHGTTSGGSFQAIKGTSDYATIGGGTGNTISGDADGATIAGGQANTVSGQQGVIAGGSTNTVSGTRSVIAGGINGVATGANSGIVGGSGCKNYGDSAFIAGGTSQQLGSNVNAAWGTYSYMGGGLLNLLGTTAQAQYGVVGGGRANQVQTDYGTVLGGRENVVKTNNFGQASGYGAVADKYGQNARAAGYFAAAGDAQISDLVLRASTTSATAAALRLDGANWKALMSLSGNLWAFSGHVVAHRTDVAGDNAAFKIEGALTRDATATGRMLGAPTVTQIGAEGTAAAWTVAITTNGSGELVITVTGEAGKTIRWVAGVRLTEVAS